MTWLVIRPVFSSYSSFVRDNSFLFFYASASSHSFQSRTHFSIVLLHYWVFPCDEMFEAMATELDFSLLRLIFLFFFSSLSLLWLADREDVQLFPSNKMKIAFRIIVIEDERASKTHTHMNESANDDYE